MDNAKIGLFISSRRKELGMTQQELADKLQITNRAVSKWEKGDGLPDISMLEPLSAELEVTVDEILSGEPCPKADTAEALSVVTDLPQDKKGLSIKKILPLKKIYLPLLFSFALTIMYSYKDIISASRYLILFFTNPRYKPTGLIAAFICLADMVFWFCISRITYSSLCASSGYTKTSNRKASVVALIIGIGLVFPAGSSYLQINTPLFTLILGLCAVLSVYHGYRTPFKIFYGMIPLSIVAGYGLDLARNLSKGGMFHSVPIDNKATFVFTLITQAVTILYFWIIYGFSVKATAKRKEIIAE